MSLQTKPRPTSKRISLRGAPSSQLQIDEAAGIVRGVAVASCGPAIGHGFSLDARSLMQAKDLIESAGGVVVHLKHGNDDRIDRIVGKIVNPRISGDVLRADLVLGDFAEVVPGLGDVKSYILRLAKEQPGSIGLSMVIEMTTEYGGAGTMPVGRIAKISAVDLVEQPAANRHGLLSQPPKPTRKLNMNPQLKSHLVSEYGLNPEASDEQAQAFFDALSPDEQAACETAAKATAGAGAAMSALSAGDDDAQVVALEKKRCSNIRALAQSIRGIPESFVNEQIALSRSIPEVRTAMLEWLKENAKAPREIGVGEDRNIATLHQAAVDAVALQSGGVRFFKTDRSGRVQLDALQRGIVRQPSARAIDEFAGLSTHEIGARYLARLGVDVGGLSRAEILMAMFNPRRTKGRVRVALAQGSSDFDSVITSSVNAVLRSGYQEHPPVWPLFCSRGTSPDFKTNERPILSEVATPPAILEGGEYTQTQLSDDGETFALIKHGEMVRLTWVAVINDSLNAFMSIMRKLGQACRRLEDDKAFTPITANSGSGQTMSDSVALFHSSHANLVSATTAVGAPTTALLSALRVLLGKQTGPKGATLNLTPAAALVPLELATVMEQLVASTVDPSKSNDTVQPAWIRSMIVVPNARLSTASAYAWYLAAPPTQCEGIEVCFLESEPEPVMEQVEDFDTDDQKYKVRHSVNARALDYRAFVKNNGTIS